MSNVSVINGAERNLQVVEKQNLSPQQLVNEIFHPVLFQNEFNEHQREALLKLPLMQLAQVFLLAQLRELKVENTKILLPDLPVSVSPETREFGWLINEIRNACRNQFSHLSDGERTKLREYLLEAYKSPDQLAFLGQLLAQERQNLLRHYWDLVQKFSGHNIVR